MANKNKQMVNDRHRFGGYRAYPGGVKVCNDTWKTGLNNNDVIIGPSGAGKTRNIVIPNILTSEESFIVADTKGMIYEKYGNKLREKGFQVELIDFVAPDNSTIGYNPLDYIERNDEGVPREKDLNKIASIVCQTTYKNSDPFWETAAQGVVASAMAFCLDVLPKSYANFRSVATLMRRLEDDSKGRADHPEESLDFALRMVEKMFDNTQMWVRPGRKDYENKCSVIKAVLGASRFSYRRLLDCYSHSHGDSLAEKLYDVSVGSCGKADKMTGSIAGVASNEMRTLAYEEACCLYEMDRKLDFKELGKKKMAVFLTISDTDRSADKLVNMFYTQAFNILCESADRDYETHYLDVPVRLYLDDFATNVVIPDFDKLISVIRSREIYTSIVLQSLSQLEDLYGRAKAATILNNCDHCLYLGGRDLSTVQYIAHMANKSEHSVMMLPRKHYYLITTGEEPRLLNLFPDDTDEVGCYGTDCKINHGYDYEPQL